MELQKIQVTKKRTLNITFKNETGDIVSVAGANLVHKDLRSAMNALIPHIAFATEQHETYGKTLQDVEANRIQDDSADSVFRWLSVDTITIAADGITLAGTRILQTGDVIKVESPVININGESKYLYPDELSLAVEAVKYEAEAYYTEQKWGVKEGTLDFGDEDPFKAEDLTADEVPSVEVPSKPKKNPNAKTVKIAS